MKLVHIQKQNVMNSLCRIVKELDGIMYPSGMKDEIRFVQDIHTALNCKYSKIEIANLLRRIMSCIILTNAPIPESQLAGITIKTIAENELQIIYKYIIAHNRYIAEISESSSE